MYVYFLIDWYLIRINVLSKIVFDVFFSIKSRYVDIFMYVCIYYIYYIPTYNQSIIPLDL